jgi:hypothetical protein
MHLILGEDGVAVGLYADRYPQHALPTSCTSHDINVPSREAGTVRPTRRRSTLKPDAKERILRHVEGNPRTGVKSCGTYGATTLWQSLCEQLLHPYHLQRVKA